jgi:hypothetical protein
MLHIHIYMCDVTGNWAGRQERTWMESKACSVLNRIIAA